MTQNIERLAGLPGGAARGAFLITPSDSTDLTTYARGFYIATAGTCKITTLANDIIVTPSLAAGYHPIAVKRFWQTSTTATGIMGLYD